MDARRGPGVMAVVITAAIAGTAMADELPRYRLEPGMELSYKGTSIFRHQNGAHVDESVITAWVIRKNADGSFRLVLRQGSRFTATPNGDSDKGSAKKQPEPPMDFNVGYFDLFTDGRLGPDADLGYRISSSSWFPRLPDDESQAKTGWSERDDRMGQEFQYSALGPSQAAGRSKASASVPRTRSMG